MASLLIVDDEASLCDLLRRYLGRQGHHVDAASSPAEAWQWFDADARKYALVITDLNFEGESGEELLERMRRRNPELRAILTSGYPYSPRLPGVDFLQKPFLPGTLADAVEKALGSK
jgi:DNA-binding NtrC family response regulator